MNLFYDITELQFKTKRYQLYFWQVFYCSQFLCHKWLHLWWQTLQRVHSSSLHDKQKQIIMIVQNYEIYKNSNRRQLSTRTIWMCNCNVYLLVVFETVVYGIPLTTVKKVVNRSNLQDSLHVFMQDANFWLPIWINDKFCWNANIY